ncbi:MAG: DUF4115 domain-containing protein [Proteobacteria bacterium]|nr:DUF4115 domain-containing protein [Pseudomonadota bacterium]
MNQSNEFALAVGGGCGARLANARQAAGLAPEDVASRLKMPLRVVRALEADDASVLGAPVFVRGQLRSYARLLHVDIESELSRSDVAVVTPPELVSHSHTPRYRRLLEQTTRRAVYIVLTLAIALPAWLGMKPHLSNDLPVASLDFPAVPPAAQAARPAGSPPQRTPVIASMASIPAAPVAAAAPGLSLQSTDETWLEVFAHDGSSIEQGTLPAGSARSYEPGRVGRVVLGNSAAVQLRNAGTLVDLTPFTRANVARFRLSSDGSLVPVED